jgi:amidase
MEAHLRRIEDVNPKVNAIVTIVAERALAQAQAADFAIARGDKLGVLHGLPVAHKDLFATAGIRTTFGSRIFEDHIPTTSAIPVEKLQEAGAITIGKTNTPEFGAGSQTFNEVFGPTRNPHDLSKTCGGSSGGSAVAVACGMVPIADGTDSGGSLRNPPAFCGVVGMRTSPGRVANPVGLNPWSTLSVSGPIARNVGDLALALSAMAGPDERCPISITEPASIFTQDLNRNFKGVRVAWFKDMGGIPFEPAILETVHAQRKVLEDLGCVVEEAEPDFEGVYQGYDTLRALGFVGDMTQHYLERREMLKETIVWEIERGLQLDAHSLAGAYALKGTAWEMMHKLMQTYEYFICPTTQVLPFDVNQPYPTQINSVKMQTYVEWQKSCILVSALENPAISVPCGYVGNLPVGLQIVGRHRQDFSVLQFAHAYEQATPHHKRVIGLEHF